MLPWLKVLIGLGEIAGDVLARRAEARLSPEERAALAKRRRRQLIIWILILITAVVAAMLILWDWRRRTQ
jgi:type VI protein secretion system component VasF